MTGSFDGVVRSTTTRLGSEVDLLAHLRTPEGAVAWLSEATSLVGIGPFFQIDPGTGPQRFETASRRFEQLLVSAEIADDVDLPGTGPVLFGSFTFDPQVPGSTVVVPSTVYGEAEGVVWRTEIELARYPGPPAPQTGAPGGADAQDQEWMAAVLRARSAIRSGLLEKVVLARRVTVPAQPGSTPGLVRRLRRTYPGCFTFSFDNLVGASPELLVRRLGEVVDSIPLAGSAPRGASESEDAELGRQLRDSAKDQREHALTVASVVDRLGEHCSNLVAEQEPSLLLLPNLQHLSTKVQGRLRAGADALRLAGALHPTAAVCGVPREEALRFIRQAETFDRGRYAGPIGWMDRHGDGEWALALRCALVKNDTARVYAGAGIVAGSDPASELAETRLKLNAMLSALESAT
ncbi:MAG: isochorismate synthase [Actinomycetota bacterium]